MKIYAGLTDSAVIKFNYLIIDIAEPTLNKIYF